MSNLEVNYWQVTGKLKYRLILAQTDLQNEEQEQR